MNILKALKTDHQTVKGILREITETSERAEKKRMELFMKFKQEITAHARSEEKVVYDRLKPKVEKNDRGTILEAYEEHYVVDKLIPEIEALSPKDETWLAKVTVVKEALEHHIKEEESEIFGMVRKQFDAETQEEMAADFESLKSQIKTKVKAA